MRKLLICILCFVLICYIVPSIFVRKSHKVVDGKIEIKENIRLLISSTGEVVEMKTEEYLKGVLIGEMPATYEMEALKAQAIVARTYTAYKLKYASSAHDNSDMCDDINHCQAYKTKEYAFESWDDSEENEKWKKISDAVESTKGEIITYNGELINAFFHAHSGGKTENVKFIWGRQEIPYLKTVDSPEIDSFEDSKVYSKEEFINILKSKYSDFEIGKEYNVEINAYTESGRIDYITIGNTKIMGTEVRTLFNLRSTNFEIEIGENEVKFKTKGYGHGVGMSQQGANQMALNGSTYEEIIKHYYTGVEIFNVNTENNI